MEGTLDHHEVLRSREALTGDLGSLSHPPTRVPRPKANGTAMKQPLRRQGRREGERQSATGGVRGSIAVGAVGRKRPRSRQRPRGAHREVLASPAIRRSGTDVVKRSFLRSCRTEPKTPWGVPAAKVAGEAGNTRGVGARKSFGWQTSIGRIVRLLHWEVARPVGARGR